MNANSQMTVRQIALENPQAARVFENLGIDYCCGGAQPLEAACRQANVAVEAVLDALSRPGGGDEGNGQWATASLTELADHIVSKHHSYVRQELPRLTKLAAKVRQKHGAGHPELDRVERLMQVLASELTMHMHKEEQVLFPMIRALDEAVRSGEFQEEDFRGIEFPVGRMISEHEDAGEVLRDLRSTTGGYRAPEDGCASFLALYQGLEEFERDLHQHIHLENNILFPRALEMAGASIETSDVIG